MAMDENIPEDPLLDAIVVSIVDKVGSLIRVESNCLRENDLIATLVKGLIAVTTDALFDDEEIG